MRTSEYGTSDEYSSAARSSDCQAGPPALQLDEQPGLADARLAEQHDDRAVRRRRRASAACSRHGELALATDEREVVGRAAGLAVGDRADHRRLDEGDAVLDLERRERLLLEAGVGPVEDGPGGDDLAAARRSASAGR